jgi:hypothetical protein
MCGHTRKWHQTWHPRHPFNALAGDLNKVIPKIIAEDAPPSPVVSSTFDPALRMALVNAGVITVEQIEEAERLMRVLQGGLGYESTHLEAPDNSG